MAPAGPQRFRNSLLSALPPAALAVLEPALVPVDLRRRHWIEQPNRKITQVLFPETAIASIVAPSVNGAEVEVGIIGREGMTGVALIHQTDRSPYSVYIQVPGTGHRVDAALLRGVLDNDACRGVFLAAAQGFLLQVAETAVANARATISERLARWLLMVRDRVDTDEIPLTHEFLALMMGARRPGVTEAIHDLTRRGLIAGTRGRIAIVDRAGLVEHAGRFYGIPERELKRLLG